MQEDLRNTALGAARSYLRRAGIDPMSVGPDSAFAALDDLMRLDGGLDAAIWWMNAVSDDDEIKRFKREWKRWQKEMKGMRK